jgi:hypothetical protein
MSDIDRWQQLVEAHRLVERREPDNMLDQPPVHEPTAAILACGRAGCQMDCWRRSSGFDVFCRDGHVCHDRGLVPIAVQPHRQV